MWNTLNIQRGKRLARSRREQLCERFRLFVGEIAGNLEGMLAMLWY